MIPALLDQEVSTQVGAAGGGGGRQGGWGGVGGERNRKRQENLGSLAFKSAATSNARTGAGPEKKRLKVPPLFSSPTGRLIN